VQRPKKPLANGCPSRTTIDSASTSPPSVDTAAALVRSSNESRTVKVPAIALPIARCT
jgi:hypothetical protein